MQHNVTGACLKGVVSVKLCKFLSGMREDFIIPPVVQPAQLLETVVIGLTGQVIQRIAEEVDRAPLPGGIGQHPGESVFEPA